MLKVKILFEGAQSQGYFLYSQSNWFRRKNEKQIQVRRLTIWYFIRVQNDDFQMEKGLAIKLTIL